MIIKTLTFECDVCKSSIDIDESLDAYVVAVKGGYVNPKEACHGRLDWSVITSLDHQVEVCGDCNSDLEMAVDDWLAHKLADYCGAR